MGSINMKGLNVRKFNEVNVDNLWKRFSGGGRMEFEEFEKFLKCLAGILEIPASDSDYQTLFTTLQKKGEVHYSNFQAQFDSWSNLTIKELEGFEVLEPNLNLTRITKTYELTIPTSTVCYKKLKISNPEDYSKTLKIVSSDPKTLIIRTPTLKLHPKTSEFIQFKVKLSQNCEVFIAVTQYPTGMAEETLALKFTAENRPVTPTRPHSGTLKKNKSWNFAPRRPSPKRNSDY